MHHIIAESLERAGAGYHVALAAYAVLAFLVAALCLALRFFLLWLYRRALASLFPRGQPNALAFDLLGRRVSGIAVTLVLFYIFQGLAVLGTVAGIFLAVHLLLVFFAFVRCFEAVYDSSDASKSFPIRGILQIVNAVAGILCAVVVVSVLARQSPLMIIGSLGAGAAIITLVFRDAIVGFVAGIQLISHKMISLGDWIEVPDHNANGTVVDITMTTVKVENLDRTVTFLPAYALVTESFINWQRMIDTGTRRIKRSIVVDAYGARFLSGDMAWKFAQMPLLSEYMEGIDEAGETNLGVFRAYIYAYLRSRKDIRQDLTLVVRQLESAGLGIPIEIIAFADKTVSAEFEAIQSGIFEHLYAVIGEFGLEAYQRPTGQPSAQNP